MSTPDISKLLRSMDGIERVVAFTGARISERELAKQHLADIRRFLIQCEPHQDKIVSILSWQHAWKS